MIRTRLAAFLIIFAASVVITSDTSAVRAGDSEWVMYAQEANGDVYFYDPSRVEKIGSLRHVWNGVQYKTSVMGASSFLSLLEIDCPERTEKILQSTFFTDKHWEKAAMKTNTAEKPKTHITIGSTTDRLTDLICN